MQNKEIVHFIEDAKEQMKYVSILEKEFNISKYCAIEFMKMLSSKTIAGTLDCENPEGVISALNEICAPLDRLAGCVANTNDGGRFAIMGDVSTYSGI